ncbi:polysaccharide biosynthesis protein vipA/tviB [Xylariales sp. PMI_506]|nr:polysaccharide biosynthesis protein vipA/tviB [Xylariales sp. PMI_506]
MSATFFSFTAFYPQSSILGTLIDRVFPTQSERKSGNSTEQNKYSPEKLHDRLYDTERSKSLLKRPSLECRNSDEGYYTASPIGEGTDDDATSDRALESIASTIKSNPPPRALVAIVGVGFVGLELVLSFASVYRVIGFDISSKRVQHLNDTYGRPDGDISFTNDAADLAKASHFLISVPTLLLPDKTIDSSALQSALKIIGQFARPGCTVVVESSVAVGMTRQLLGPLAAEKSLFAGMSPERVDPGRAEPPIRSIPKVISGLDDVMPGSLDAITQLYSAVFDNVVPVSAPEVAEMVKLYENCQRMMCIAYANEMADACSSHGINPYEVCAAAATKPFGYMPYTPGLGVGGHCIPINPYYLFSNSQFPLLKAATEKMCNRPAALASQTLEWLGVADPQKGEGKRNPCATSQRRSATPKVLVVGVGFKRGQSHLANSPGLDLARSLQASGRLDVTWADPLVAQSAIPDIKRLPDEDWNVATLDTFDLIHVAFRQVDMDFEHLCHLHSARVEMWCN